MWTGIIKKNFEYLKKGGKSLFIFEAIYKLVAVIVVTPLLIGLLNLSIMAAGVKYLGDDTLKIVLCNPVTIVGLLILFVIMAFYSLAEMMSVIIAYHSEQKYSPWQLFILGLSRAKRIVKPKNFMLVIFVILIIPLTGSVVAGGFVSTIEIPEFIMTDIKEQLRFFIPFAIAIVFLTQLAIKWIFSLHCFSIEELDFKQATAKSRKMVRGNFWKIIGHLILWNVIIYVTLAICYGVIIGIIALLIKIMGPTAMVLAWLLPIFKIIGFSMLFIMGALGVPLNFAMLSNLYYTLGGSKDALKNLPEPKESKIRQFKIKKSTIAIIVVVALVVGEAFLYSGTREVALGKVDTLSLPEISAHRGDAISAPENTIPAFDSAIKHKADFAELDVHQTKDGKIVVLHDGNLKRTTGLNKDVCDATYAEIKKLDAGSWYSDKYKGTKVPTLDEVIKHCKGKIKLNIELKPSDKDTDFEKQVAEIVRKNNFEKDCVFTSLNKDSLVRLKKYAPEMTAGYIMSVAYGNIYKMKYIDFFSIDSAFVTASMVKKCHDAGKDLYVWTVDDEGAARDMVSLNVDNIITNNPVNLRKIVYSKNSNTPMRKILENVLGK